MTTRRWLVESYWPSSAGSPDTVAEGLRATIARSGGMALVGVVHVPGDEAILWRFEAPDGESIRALLGEAGIGFDRIIEVVEIETPTGT